MALIASPEATPDRRFPAAAAVLEDAVAAGRVPGAVAAVADRRGILHESACGAARTVAPAPMQVDSVFRIASMTKLITSIAVMMLCEEGKLRLDDEFAAHVPGFEQPGVLVSFDDRTGEYAVRQARRAVTVRDLLTHTSGFGYWFLHREVLIEAKGRIDYFDAPFLMHDPGERFCYGISTDVLGLIVEPLSGLSLARFMEERIARPLGLSATGFDPPAERSRLVGLHKRRGGKFVDAPNEERGEPPRGGGGLYATAGDYLAVLRMLLNEGRLDGGARLLSEESVAMITTNQIGDLYARLQTSAFSDRTLDFAFLDGTQKFGFNVMIETRDRPEGRAAGSYGWGGIYNTYYWADPKAGIAAVLMMQLSPFCDPRCLAVYRGFERAVYDAVAGVELAS